MIAAEPGPYKVRPADPGGAQITGLTDSLALAGYSDVVGFTNLTSGAGNTSRSVSLTVDPATTTVELTVTVNHPAWGTVSPTNSTYATGSTVELIAAPALYYRFSEWNGGATGTNDQLTLVLNSNTTVVAVFGEVLTTNYPTPHSWLASNGYTNDFETVVANLGINDMPLWQSYIAGLDPNDPASQLRLTLDHATSPSTRALRWSTVSGRIYSVWNSTNLLEGFAPMPGATDLPWTIQGVTNAVDAESPTVWYRLEVRKQ